ncbi:hypothetical protein BZG35_17035 [Brevundimonas sp. LM2]|uniref:glycerophosphodiester phosphodiesterase family protein n=1 Tax=Brevundimonas sp. LM2 TaxID=1938605 RepID=UPI0009840980|nr:glycerophosphodiester phosphodiesterase family protein [Brevundimonas sp. LM2]AQR63162.1 hypothetical protein BZG35_17035 [Brevundimonas sp. LM2]
MRSFSLTAALAIVIAAAAPAWPGRVQAKAQAQARADVGADRIAALRALVADPAGPVLVIAHRACWKDAPENSLPAIAACRRLGVAMVELDVRRTRDGHLVLMHDATVDRTTDGHGAVVDLTLAQIQALRLRTGAGGPGAALTDLAPPTLEEALEAARDGVLINVDAKAEVFDQVGTLLERLDLTDHVLMKTAVVPAAGQPFPALFRSALFMPIVDERQGPMAAAIAPYDPLSPVAAEVLFRDEAYFSASVRTLKAAGRRAWINTLGPTHAAGHVDADAAADPEAHWGHLIDLGASMIQTDEPEALIAYLARRAARPAARR